MRFWLAHLALLPLCAWALVQVFTVSSSRAAVGVATWLVAAVVVHDLVLLPLYSGADRGLRAVVRRESVNYVRIPAALSLLLLGVFWGTITGAGRPYDGYAARWLLATAALFAASAVIFLVRRRSAGRHRPGR